MSQFAKNRRANNRNIGRPPSLVNGNENEIHAQLKKTQLWSDVGGKLFSKSSNETSHRMNMFSLMKIIVSIRAASSFWSVIGDCDEVYNYWEPLHLLMFGHGFQTWEYSPEYAIRSWAYIYIHYLAGSLLQLLSNASKIVLFHFVRFLIAAFSSVAEYLLYHSACERLGNDVGSFFIIFSLFSVAMFNASCAFLPSSFAMTMSSFATAAYLKERWFWAILCTAVSALVGWPFTAILGLPIIVEMLIIRQKQLGVRFVFFSAVGGILCLIPMLTVDSFYYGKWTIAPANIVHYNIFSQNGPNLYGVENASFYIKNLMLNWNVATVLAAFSPVSILVYMKLDSSTRKGLQYWYRFVPVGLIFITTAVWLTIFFWQPHKEERFLYPIYPMIALLSAISLHSLTRLIRHYYVINLSIMLVFIVASFSRGYALHRNYAGSMETFSAFNEHLLKAELDFNNMNNPIRLCLGKEWHRFPSSFFIPEKVYNVDRSFRKLEVEFIRSSFRGILPKHFEPGTLPNITRLIPSDMNDENREESSRYISAELCDYIVDFDTRTPTAEDPNFSKTNSFKVIFERPFLIAEHSHVIFRAFYVPFTHGYLSYGSYQLLKRFDD